MKRRRFLRQLLLGSGAVAIVNGPLGPTSVAHRSLVTLSRVQPNPRTGRWEFSHAIHYHDASTALRRLEPTQRLAPTMAAGQARLMLEIETRILWETATGRFEPEAVGAELIGDSLLLYQESKPMPAGTVTLESRLLQDVFPRQVHHVSIEWESPSRLLRLSAENPRAVLQI